MHPIVKLTTETKVPKYLPKIKPVVKAIGEAKPKSKIHTMVKIKNIYVFGDNEKIIRFIKFLHKKSTKKKRANYIWQ